MKNILLAICLALTLVSCSEEEKEVVLLQERDNLMFEPRQKIPFTGKNVMRWESGQKKLERTYKDGKLDGIEIRWYENGQKKLEKSYKDGKADGAEIRWYSNGEKKWETTYKDDKIVQ